MRTIDAIAQILKKEGIEYLSAFPTTAVIEAAADVASALSSAGRSALASASAMATPASPTAGRPASSQCSTVPARKTLMPVSQRHFQTPCQCCCSR